MALSGQSERLPITFERLSASNFLSDLVIESHPRRRLLDGGHRAACRSRLARNRRSRRPDAPLRLFLLSIVAVALALSAMVDIITLDGDIDRMNTVFKFYIHIWLLLAVAGAFGVWYVLAVLGWRPLKSRGSRGARIDLPKTAWAVALVILVGGGLIYPISGTRARVDTSERFPQYHGHTNDGMNFMRIRRLRRRVRRYRSLLRLRRNPVDARKRAGLTGHRRRTGPRIPLGRALLDLHRPADRHRLGLAPEAAARRLRRPCDRARERLDRVLLQSDHRIRCRIPAKVPRAYVIVGQLERALLPKSGFGKFAAMAAASSISSSKMTRSRSTKSCICLPLSRQRNATPPQ